MKIVLEFEDVRLLTTAGEYGNRRVMTAKVGDMGFFSQSLIEPERWDYDNRYREMIHGKLKAEMEAMLEGIFLTAASSVAPGAVQTKCPTGELWRFHYGGKCGCRPVRFGG